jgi:hydroxypyruvate reductase
VLRPSQATAEELAAEYAALARRAARRGEPGPIAFVRAAEPSVVVDAGRGRGGRGGRSTHVAALVGRALAVEPCRAVRFAAFASDGVDGSSATGGAMVSQRFAAQVGDGALGRAIAAFDTGTLHQRMGTALASAPTGHNMADLHVLVVR